MRLRRECQATERGERDNICSRVFARSSMRHTDYDADADYDYDYDYDYGMSGKKPKMRTGEGRGLLIQLDL